MTTENRNNDKLLPPAPQEAVQTMTLPYNVRITRELNTSSKVSVCSTMSTILSNQLTGMGRVDLIKIEILFKLPTEGLSISFGTYNSGATVTHKQAAANGGLNITSNKFNAGVQQLHELVPPGIYSRQIQPPSSEHPAFNLYLECSAGAEVMIIAYIKFDGFMNIFTSGNP